MLITAARTPCCLATRVCVYAPPLPCRKTGSDDVLTRYGYLLAPVDVGNAAFVDRIADRFLDVLLEAPQESLSVYGTLLLSLRRRSIM